MSPVLAAPSPGGRTMTLHEAAREIEAQFLVEMLKAARQAGEPLAESSEMTGAENYQEFAERFLAQELARRETLGLARLLERELAANPTSEPRP